jgi:predicted GIY-YIG superfamily endonuclease
VTSGQGTVYLIHFDARYKHAGHYIGWTSDLETRLAEHARGHGARLMAVITAAGITWQLVRTWPGTRRRERQIKNQGGASRCCPRCGVRPRTTSAPLVIRAAQPVPEVLPAPCRVPAAERGAAAARVLIGQQVAAGYGLDQVAKIQRAVFRDYDPAIARPAAREWHDGYQAAAAGLLADLAAAGALAGAA